MTNRRSGRWPSVLRRIPADLLAVLAVLLVSNVSMLVPWVRTTPLRIPLGFVLFLFLPGYVLVALLFPKGGDSPSVGRTPNEGRETLADFGLDGSARVLLSVVSSLVIVMGTILALDVTAIGITLETTLMLLDAFVILATVVAAVRRIRLPPEQRLDFPVRSWIESLRDDTASFNRVDRLLAIGLVVCVLFAAIGTVYTASVPGKDDRYTEFYLLQENERGTLTASDYSEGDSNRFAVGISNHEQRAENYTVVVRVQTVENRSSSGRILRSRELYRFTPEVRNEGTWQKRHTVRFPRSEENVRLVYLLYRGSPPADPTRENAYRELHLWINASR